MPEDGMAAPPAELGHVWQIHMPGKSFTQMPSLGTIPTRGISVIEA